MDATSPDQPIARGSTMIHNAISPLSPSSPKLDSSAEILQQLLENGQISRKSYELLLMANQVTIPKSADAPASISKASASARASIASVRTVIRLSHDDRCRQELGGEGEDATPKIEVQETFDWFHDDLDLAPTPSKIAKSKRSSPLWKWIKSWPLFPQTILTVLFGGILIMIPGSLSIIFCVKDRGEYWTHQTPNCMGIGGYPFFVFATYFTILWAFYWGVRYVLRILPEVLIRLSDICLGTSDEGETNAFVEHLMDYLRHMRRAIAYLLLSVIGLTTFTTIFTEHTDNTIYYNWQQVITLIWSSLVWSCFVWVSEKFLLQVFAVQFSKRAFSERLEAEKFAFHVLGCLNRARYRPNSAIGINMPMKSDLSDSNHSSELELAVKDLESQARKTLSRARRPDPWLGAGGFSRFQQGVGKHAARLGLNLKNVAGVVVGVESGETAGVLLRSLHDAKMLSKRIFLSLQRGSSGVLVPEDFRPFFLTQEDALAAFKLFDKDDNGDISPQEMKATVVEIYRERLSLDRSIRDGNQAMHKLDGLLKVFMFALILFICLGIWGVNVTNFLAGLISLWVGILFAIGTTIKNLLESVVFLFLTHPYDVGDRVEIDGNAFIVKEFALSVTIFRTPDGKEVIAPNPLLLGKFIYNIRRSGAQSESVTLHLDGDTTESQLQELKDRLNDFAQNSSRDFSGNIIPTISQINAGNELVISIGITHKANWSNFGNKVVRTNRFMIELRKILKDLKIEMSSSALTVKMDTTPSFDSIVGTQQQHGDPLGVYRRSSG
ncbi:hypothetical protein SmJEL517_g00848 [Synchytrium microbalum]|uniref:EF-hand domain-containing protein n=1 Tax=Synchytrium microbalum TaxID=1806994 RepID=A0A507C619_9FUNG|nr:uncharacterized protein SmJEL517_g00848 [Synchytrium microbalum]TPX37040.1 hypothetical protein SmJEL517_g00848 [Synchytrium microbalum]